MLAEYRGYGGLGGVPSYDGLREDARAAWSAAECIASLRDTQPISLGLFGHSLGSAIAAELAAELPHLRSETNHKDMPPNTRLNALLLQSPFTSARDMVRVVSTPPVRLVWEIISRVHYDTRARLSQIPASVSIAHGLRDWLVPVAMGRELFARARVPGQLLVVEHAGHNDVAEFGGDAYWQWVCDALTERPTTCLEVGSTRRTETSD
jgi:pimeloyl-ACP methyl ester carboxylesterase